MSKLRIVHIASLVILGVLIAFTVFRPMTDRGQFSEVQSEGLLQTKDGWIVEYDIMNHEGRDQNYTITVVIDGEPYCEKFVIQDGKKVTYIHHIRRDRMTKGIVTCTICKEGEETPFEQSTHYLR